MAKQYGVAVVYSVFSPAGAKQRSCCELTPLRGVCVCITSSSTEADPTAEPTAQQNSRRRGVCSQLHALAAAAVCAEGNKGYSSPR